MVVGRMNGAVPREVGRAVVLGEGGSPGARAVLGLIVSRAASVDLAIDGIRLAAIDFPAEHLAALQRCRVVLGRFDIHALAGAVQTAAQAAGQAAPLAVLRAFLAGGRAAIRSAGARRWNPDFCIARGPALARWFEDGVVVLVGYLGLGAENPLVGPRLTCVLTGRGAAGVVAHSFERLWSAGHDIVDVVVESLAHE
jgi:hypothetical protein